MKKKYGKADRVEQTAYEYEEYVFTKGVQGYMTVGVLADRVVRINVVGNKLEINPFEIGMPVETIMNRYAMESEIIVNSSYGKYQLSLSEDDLYTRPLIKLAPNRYAQLTIDSNARELFAVSFMDSDTLVKLHPYESVYEGELYEVPKLSDEKWRQINAGMNSDIVDLTNIYRTKRGLSTLVENKKIGQAASAHSKDMHENEFFSHDSATKGDLAKRMTVSELVFEEVEENIAANYVDGAATFAAWLSSASHRQTLELENANVMGVGSFQFYTTQIIGYVAEVTDPS
ncbi:CAP domain-containing protein [Brochothrix campestris]|uniref:SCP-like extracellular n=1 Tax=Brochothrix campestris FSL F6-1037 TaxID=1265861 RepID=W7CXQ9_9LIST|nr:CAP-associated domain-containing protein [Brochothrix campestris]EUJ41752.1 SCP-like extracellular [Brochothrix campestris FSL F6-1037]